MNYLLKTLSKLSDEQISDAWTLYETCMAKLEIYTPQNHLMERGEFDALMLDERISKGLVLDDAELVAFGTYTTDLTAVPLINWKFYRHWWTDEYDRSAIIYVPFIVAAGQHRAYRAFVEHVFSLAAPVRGLVAIDVSDYNEHEHHFVDAIAITTRRLSHGRSRHYRVGYQGYWIYDVTGLAASPVTGQADTEGPASENGDLVRLDGVYL